MGDFLAFRKMITPLVIQVLFWLGVVVAVGAGLFTLITADGFQKIVGLLTLAFGPIVVRIYCELLIVLFKMHECLNDIADSTGRRAA
jgi:hypothetical protein